MSSLQECVAEKIARNNIVLGLNIVVFLFSGLKHKDSIQFLDL
jgi:hypothetical protein